MKTFYILICVSLSQAVPYYKEWKLFKTTHGKQYGTAAEEQYRMKVFYKNKQMIDEHNKIYEQGIATFTMAMNRFGDLTLHEYNSMMNGFKLNKSSRKTFGSTFVPSPSIELPEVVDWRETGAVTEVKNQQHCGSCYAFSVTGALEGQYFIKHNRLASLSEQQIVDCCYNQGCQGGQMDEVFEYIKQTGGIDTEEAYPYTAEEDPCKFNKSGVVTTDKGYVDVSPGDENALEEVVATVGPTSVGIDASRGSFQFYSGGIYLDEHCSAEQLNHAVLVVGYGKERGEDYWLVKNSWGAEWGIDGYVKMARNKGNHCGIASSASYPIL